MFDLTIGEKEWHDKHLRHIDDMIKSIAFNFLEGDMSELYKSIVVTFVAQGNWITWIIV